MTLRATGYRRKGRKRKDDDEFDTGKKPRRSFLGRVFFFCLKWGFVLGVWATLFVLGLVAWYARELPEITRSPQFERKPSITVLANDGSVIARYGDIKGESLALRDMPTHLVHAVIATEDRRFYYHFGVDPVGIARAIYTNLRRKGVVQGGSTITQQLAKNLFLTQERTFKRKVQEALLALWLEKELSKDEILTAYLNRVYMGAGTYGVDAASQVYFKKSARDLTLRESAMLAGLLKAPSRYSPKSNPVESEQRANVVIGAMKAVGYLDEKEERAATRLPTPRRKPAANDSGQYYADWVVEQLDDLIGTPEKDIIIETAMDPDIQKGASGALIATLNQEGEAKRVSQGAVMVLRRDGAVLAMVGGRDYGVSQFNRSTHALRQPGSSFKPVVYLTALEAGATPDMIVEDSPLTEGRYRPQNFDGEYYGLVPLNVALAFSLNTVAVKLMQEVGVDAVIDVARRLGITSDLEPNLSTALGSSSVRQIELAGAYATLASGGLAVVPYGILKIKDSDGSVLYERPENDSLPRVLSANAVQTLNHMMAGVIDYGTGQGAKLGVFAAGKTGTSQDYRDAWFNGFTNDYVASVWIGNDDNTSMKKVTGGSLPAHIWRSAMTAAMADPTPSPDHSPQADTGAFSTLIDRMMNLPNNQEGYTGDLSPWPLQPPENNNGYIDPATGVWKAPRRKYND